LGEVFKGEVFWFTSDSLPSVGEIIAPDPGNWKVKVTDVVGPTDNRTIMGTLQAGSPPGH
jgi:hypothetical protein